MSKADLLQINTGLNTKAAVIENKKPDTGLVISTPEFNKLLKEVMIQEWKKHKKLSK